LELVPGETLAARLSKGRLSVEEALRIATQIADALEEAHEEGIIHRDLKPGKIKVLDFGLARAFAEDNPEADTSLSPTLTRAGIILGTASFMSPEQQARQAFRHLLVGCGGGGNFKLSRPHLG